MPSTPLPPPDALPEIGTRWTALTPERRASLPAGTVLSCRGAFWTPTDHPLDVPCRDCTIRSYPPTPKPEGAEAAPGVEAGGVHPPDEAPTLTLRRRTPNEVRAFHEGARLALTMVLGRLPAVTRIPREGSVPAVEVWEALEFVTEALNVGNEAAGFPRAKGGAE